jgi:hypothetical protein
MGHDAVAIVARSEMSGVAQGINPAGEFLMRCNALARYLLLAVLVGDRVGGSHRKDAKDAKETAKGANGCQ